MPDNSSHDRQPPRPPVDAGAAASPPPPPPGYPPYMLQSPPPAGRRGGVISKMLTSVFVSLFLVSVALNVYLGAFFVSLAGGPTESTYQEGDSLERVVILPIEGGIDGDMADFVRLAVQALEEDVPAAIILRVESGGGTVGASDQIWHALRQYRDEHPDVPMIASFGTVAASGGYYVAMPTDEIWCEAAGITGSIGVMAQIPTIQGLLDKVGVSMHVIVADQSDKKDIANNLFRQWTAEDQEAVQRLVNEFYDRFFEVVVQGRPNVSQEQLREVANGRIYTAARAKELQLIDDVGYLGDVIKRAAQLANIAGKPRVTRIERRQPFGLLGLFGARRTGPALAEMDAATLRTTLQDLAEVEFVYRMPLR